MAGEQMKRLLKQAVIGATAGSIAAFAMRQFVLLWDQATRGRAEAGAFGLDREADIYAAQDLWQLLFKKDLEEADALRVAQTMHYAFSAAASAGYAVLADSHRSVRAGFGTAYGTALWLVGDEIAMSVMGVGDLRSKSTSSHASAWAAHLIFGFVTEWSRRKLVKTIGK